MAEEASKKRKWKSVGHLLYAMIPVVALASMLIFGGLYLREYFQYKAAKEEYAALADAYIQDGEGTYGSSARSTVTENAGEGSAQMQQDSGASLESGRSTNSDHAFTKGDASMNSRSGLRSSSDIQSSIRRTMQTTCTQPSRASTMPPEQSSMTVRVRRISVGKIPICSDTI